MEPKLLFTAALGPPDLWQVASIRFEPDHGAIHFDPTLNGQPADLPRLRRRRSAGS